MTDQPPFRISSTGLLAEIAARGAELVRLQDDKGRDLLWDGDPSVWAGRAPILFPNVGRLKDDQLTVDGQSYPMRQHGFARTSTFDLIAHEEALCRLRLRATDETRKSYPFAFQLDLIYSLSGLTLDIAAVVTNEGSGPLPASFGFHPALRWPLPYGADRSAHEITFEDGDPGPIAPLVGGLLASTSAPSPVHGRRLALNDALFRNDALVFLQPAGRSVRYGPAAGRSIRVAYPRMPQLGIWTKPGAGFVCIEPWHGYASPQGFDGEFAAKPGVLSIAAGAQVTFGMSMTLDPE